MRKLLTFLMLVCAIAQGQQWAGILGTPRGTDWTQAGVSGGIPVRTTKCATLSSGATASQISSAISSCGANQVVFLNAGTYNLTNGIQWSGKNNVTLRGSGANSTFLVFTNDASCHGAGSDICIDSSDTNWKGPNGDGTGASNRVDWTAGFTQGATTITLASVPNLKVGSPIILDQLDDTCDIGGLIVSQITTSGCTQTSPGVTSPYSLEGNGGGAQMALRNQVQLVTVTSCGVVVTPGASCSGTSVSVGISPGLYMPNWSGSRTPKAWWSSSPNIGSGVENLSVDNTGVGSTSVIGVEFWNCLNCYARGVRDIKAGRAHFRAEYSAHITVRDSYGFLTFSSASQSYGFECYTASNVLIENNIWQGIVSPYMINGACSGSVAGYNFSINNFYTQSSGYNIAGTNLHTAGINFFLYESNYNNQMYGDLFHGTHQINVAFRNRWTGPQPVCWQSNTSYPSAVYGSCTNNLSPIVLESYARFDSLIGNVNGTVGVNTSYPTGIYGLGSGNTEGAVTVLPDPNVSPTTMIWNNWDSATQTVRTNCSEVPTSLTGVQAPFSNACPASTALPASFYYSSTPLWWTSGKPFPAIGPDVSGGNLLLCSAGQYVRGAVTNVSQCGTGGTTTTLAAGHVNSIPAQDCYLSIMGGNPYGTSAVLPFDADNCYSLAPAPSPPPAGSPVSFTMLTGSVGISGRIGK